MSKPDNRFEGFVEILTEFLAEHPEKIPALEQTVLKTTCSEEEHFALRMILKEALSRSIIDDVEYVSAFQVLGTNYAEFQTNPLVKKMAFLAFAERVVNDLEKKHPL